VKDVSEQDLGNLEILVLMKQLKSVNAQMQTPNSYIQYMQGFPPSFSMQI